MEPEYLTPEQVAETLQITVATIRRYIRDGKLKASKLGRVYRVSRAEVERFMRELETQG